MKFSKAVWELKNQCAQNARIGLSVDPETYSMGFLRSAEYFLTFIQRWRDELVRMECACLPDKYIGGVCARCKMSREFIELLGPTVIGQKREGRHFTDYQNKPVIYRKPRRNWK